MKCPKCSDLGSVVRADPRSGEFSIQACSCITTNTLLHKSFTDGWRSYIVDEVVNGVLSVRETTNNKTQRRLINQYLFEQDFRDGILTATLA